MDPLDHLPLEKLLALHDALAELSADPRIREARREAGDGFHLEHGLPSRYDPEPIPMEAAEDGVEALTLRFDR